MKRQRSSDLESSRSQKKKNMNRSTCSEANLVAVPGSSPRRQRCKVASYDWIDDETERGQLIAEDKIRIAKVLNLAVDKIDFYSE